MWISVWIILMTQSFKCFVSFPPAGLLLPDSTWEDHLRRACRYVFSNLHAAVPLPPSQAVSGPGSARLGYDGRAQLPVGSRGSYINVTDSSSCCCYGAVLPPLWHTQTLWLFKWPLPASYPQTMKVHKNILLPEMSRFLPSSVKQWNRSDWLLLEILMWASLGNPNEHYFVSSFFVGHLRGSKMLMWPVSSLVCLHTVTYLTLFSSCRRKNFSALVGDNDRNMKFGWNFFFLAFCVSFPWQGNYFLKACDFMNSTKHFILCLYHLTAVCLQLTLFCLIHCIAWTVPLKSSGKQQQFIDGAEVKKMFICKTNQLVVVLEVKWFKNA